MFGARKRGLIRQKLEIIRFFFSLLFLSGSKRFLKTTKKFNFSVHSRKLRREKFYLGRFAKVYAREMQKFREFFRSRKFLLAKVSAPKVDAASIRRLLFLFLMLLKRLLIEGGLYSRAAVVGAIGGSINKSRINLSVHAWFDLEFFIIKLFLIFPTLKPKNILKMSTQVFRVFDRFFLQQIRIF